MKSTYLNLPVLVVAAVLSVGLSFTPVAQARSLQPADSTNKEQTLDEPPLFFGKDARNFARWVASRLRYPKSLIEARVQGRLVLKFVIECDGSLTYVETVESKITYGFPTDLNETTGWQSQELPETLFLKEALRVIKQSPRWKPARKNGEPVRVFIQIPIHFQLS